VFARNQTAADPGSLREFIEGVGGRIFEHPRVGSLEGQSPFAWWSAKHEWILRLDADEFPSPDLTSWLRQFRDLPEESAGGDAFTCIWPLWDGRRATTTRWPDGRLFLFDRRCARFVGLVEQTPVIEGRIVSLPLTLCHQPRRKSYGVRNILFRKQAGAWRRVLAASLLGSPLALPRWRWDTGEWPGGWTRVVEEPLVEGLYRMLKFPWVQWRALRTHGEKFSASTCLNPALHHFMLCMNVWQLRGFPRPRIPLRRVVRKVVLGTACALVSSRREGLQTLGGICPWSLDVSLLNKSSKVVSGGVGGDISFELELARETGCEIALFDPSPTGRATIDRLAPLPENIRFHAMALAGEPGQRQFAAPFDADEGSFREPDGAASPAFEWPCASVEEFLRREEWPQLDLLKLDIEGFEFEVLNALLKSQTRPRQLLVEFHYGRELNHSFWEYLRLLFRLRLAGYTLVHRDKADHSLVRTGQAPPPGMSPAES
jgi:FkbM family methyltransferase